MKVWLCLVLLWPVTLSAQTVINPTKVEFTPSADHGAMKIDGSAVVTSYEFSAVAMNSTGAIALTVDLAKPSPDPATGKILTTVTQLSTMTPNTLYTATILAKGPDGVSPPSVASLPFSRVVPQVPRAPGQAVLRP